MLERPDGLGTERRIAQRRTSEEGQEGLRAFLEKRDAVVGIRKAPRSEPRRDRAARLPGLPRARDRDRGGRAAGRRGLAARALGRRDGRDLLATSTPAEHIRAAQESGADAIHPGYGFLAENADFAEAVEAAGLTWVGPPPEALRAGGDKLEAKRIAREAGVPVVPEGEPDEIGFPLLVKAAAGGGGRGMRVVREPGELEEALAAARREAKAAFGDDRVFCERYVERPRHVEIQLLGDAHGTVVALGERECSVQRRHQKVLEEAPSPALDPELRARMSEAAVAFARAIGYRSAGTAEFMLDGRDFWFLELNGRIQVEHPVTELVTRRRPRRASSSGSRRASRSRPSRAWSATRSRCGSTPRTRRRSCRRPAASSGCGCRPGSASTPGVEEGDEIGTAYDPLIAKLIAHGSTRDDALDRLAAALAETEVDGVVTNLPFLRWLVAHPALRAGRDDDRLPDRAPAALGAAAAPAGPARGAAASGSTCPRRRPRRRPTRARRSRSGAARAERADARRCPARSSACSSREGDRVQPRQPLVVLEAMKMETPVVSPYEAVVRAVHVAEGDRSPAARCWSSSRSSDSRRASGASSPGPCRRSP